MAVKQVRPDLDNPAERKWLWIFLLVPVLVFALWLIEQMITSQ